MGVIVYGKRASSIRIENCIHLTAMRNQISYGYWKSALNQQSRRVYYVKLILNKCNDIADRFLVDGSNFLKICRQKLEPGPDQYRCFVIFFSHVHRPHILFI